MTNLLFVLLDTNPIIQVILIILGAILVFGFLGLILAGISRLTNTRFTNRSGRVIIDNTKKKPPTNEQITFQKQLADIIRWENEQTQQFFNGVSKTNLEYSQKTVAETQQKISSQNLDTTNFLNLQKIQTILNSKEKVSQEHNDKNIITTIIKIDEPTKFYNALGEPVFSDWDKVNQIEKRYFYTDLYSRLEIDRPSNKALLKSAYSKEKERDFLSADKLYKEYLRNIVFKVSILSANRFYDKIKIDTQICGTIKHIKTSSYELLTMESSSVFIKE